MESSREIHRSGLHPLYLPVYDSLCETLSSSWEPFFGLRSFELQEQLYEKGRSLPGKVVTNARSGFSPHNYGCASDWFKKDASGQAIWDKASIIWEEYDAAIEKAGARWGSPWGDYDHNELPLIVSWKRIGNIYVSAGIEAAMEAIEKYSI